MSNKKRIFVVEFQYPFDQVNMNHWTSSDTYKRLIRDYHVITIIGESDKFNCYLVPENIKENE
jgi:hypothetical protein